MPHIDLNGTLKRKVNFFSVFALSFDFFVWIVSDKVSMSKDGKINEKFDIITSINL